MGDHRYRDLGVIAPVRPRLHARLVHESCGLALVETEWRRAEHPERSVGRTPYFAIEWMRVGAFEKRGRRRSFHDAGSAAWFDCGEEFEVRHPVGDSNAGFTLRFSPRHIDPPIRRADAPASNAIHLELSRLAAANGDAIELDERLMRLGRAALSEIDRGIGNVATRADLDLVAATRHHLASKYSEPLRLAGIAAAVGKSPWHVCKRFLHVTGSTLHAWLVNLRLRAALARLPDCDDFSALALAVGFSNHSHFTAAFRREFGLTPRAARSELRGCRGGRLAGFRSTRERP